MQTRDIGPFSTVIVLWDRPGAHRLDGLDDLGCKVCDGEVYAHVLDHGFVLGGDGAEEGEGV